MRNDTKYLIALTENDIKHYPQVCWRIMHWCEILDNQADADASSEHAFDEDEIPDIEDYEGYEDALDRVGSPLDEDEDEDADAGD